MTPFEVEAAVCGMIMREPSHLAEAISRGLSSSSFSDGLCGHIFAACHEIWGDGLDVDLATVARKVGMGQLDDIARVRNSAPLTANFGPYLAGVLNHGIQAELVLRLHDIGRALETRRAMESLDPIVDRLVDLIGYCKGSGDALRTSPMVAELDKTLAIAQERMEAFQRGQLPGVTTGFNMLDGVLNGFQPGFVYALGARTGLGKTTFAINAALGAAGRGHKVAYVTVEMSGADIVEKMVSRESRVAGARLLAGSMNDFEVGRVEKAVRSMEHLPILFTEVVRPSFDHLAFEILRLVKIEKVELIVIDYLQLFEVGDGRFRQPREEAKIVSARLKMLAKAHKVPLLVLSQLNRQAPEHGMPDLIHIAESDQIARDSDVVMFLFKDEHEQHYLSISKNRRGKCGAFLLRAELDYSRFEGAADAH